MEADNSSAHSSVFNSETFKNLNTAELHEAVKSMKLDLERTRMENLWMESFLKENSATMMSGRGKSRRSVRFPSAYGIAPYRSSASVSSAKLPISISSKLKVEMCEREILRIESEMKKKQNLDVQQMRKTAAEIQEAQITGREFRKAIGEFKKFVVETKTKKISSEAFANFLKELSRDCEAMKESMRSKAGIMKEDLLKRKRSLVKQQQFNSCLLPVDLELALIEKSKLLKMLDESKKCYDGLKMDGHDVLSCKNREEKKLLTSSILYEQSKSKTELCESRIKKMKLKVEASVKEIEKLKKSILDLQKLTGDYEAPSVTDYIEKIVERDMLKNKLKVMKRRMNSVKIQLKNVKLKNRKQLQ